MRSIKAQYVITIYEAVWKRIIRISKIKMRLKFSRICCLERENRRIDRCADQANEQWNFFASPKSPILKFISSR